jgi:hypothetical protein
MKRGLQAPLPELVKVTVRGRLEPPWGTLPKLTDDGLTVTAGVEVKATEGQNSDVSPWVDSRAVAETCW